MPASSMNVKRQILILIKHFKFDELEKSVLPLFPEITWNKIKTKLVKNHQSFSIQNAVKMIERAVDECKIAEDSLKERLSILEVTDISRHPEKKIWYCHELKGSNAEKIFTTSRDIENKIVEFFLSHKVQVEVQTTFYDGIMFAVLREKSKKVVRIPPVFFALLLGHKHFFCSRKQIPSDFLKALANTMGYTSSKPIKLFGKDLPSLIKLLWQRRQGAIDAKTIDVPYQDFKPVIKSTGIDFTQDRHRKEYLEKCFGNKPPTMESLILESINHAWTDKGAFTKLPDKKIFVGWEFRSHSVPNFLQQLAERNIIEFPIPRYLSQWMMFGKNQLTLKET